MDRIDIIKAEIDADPLGRGYAGMSDQQIADTLNAANRTRQRQTVTATEVYQAIDQTEWESLTGGKQAEVWDILHLGTLTPGGREQDRFLAIFGAQSATIAALKGVRDETISRGEELRIGEVKHGEVIEAKRAIAATAA